MSPPSIRWFAQLILCCAALVVSPHPGFAQVEPTAAATAPSEPEGYRELVDSALREYGAGNYEESRALFLRAHALSPNARTHRGLGMVEFELRNYGESIKQLELALNSREKPLEGELLERTRELLLRAKGFVARVVVQSEPAASRIIVDGVAMELPPREALVLRVGEHTIEVQAPGHLPEKRVLHVKGGEEQALSFVLSKPTVSRAGTDEGGKRRWYKSPWLWSAVGVVVVGAAAGTSVALAKDDPATAKPYGGSSDQLLVGP